MDSQIRETSALFPALRNGIAAGQHALNDDLHRKAHHDLPRLTTGQISITSSPSTT